MHQGAAPVKKAVLVIIFQKKPENGHCSGTPNPYNLSEKYWQYTSNLYHSTPPICNAVPCWLLSLEERAMPQYTSHLIPAILLRKYQYPKDPPVLKILWRVNSVRGLIRYDNSSKTARRVLRNACLSRRERQDNGTDSEKLRWAHTTASSAVLFLVRRGRLGGCPMVR